MKKQNKKPKAEMKISDDDMLSKFAKILKDLGFNIFSAYDPGRSPFNYFFFFELNGYYGRIDSKKTGYVLYWIYKKRTLHSFIAYSVKNKLVFKLSPKSAHFLLIDAKEIIDDHPGFHTFQTLQEFADLTKSKLMQ